MDLRHQTESPPRARSLLGADGRSILRLLTPAQRESLSEIGTRVVVPARAMFYREDTPATDIYICVAGAAKSFRLLRNGARRIQVFLARRGHVMSADRRTGSGACIDCKCRRIDCGGAWRPVARGLCWPLRWVWCGPTILSSMPAPVVSS